MTDQPLPKILPVIIPQELPLSSVLGVPPGVLLHSILVSAPFGSLRESELSGKWAPGGGVVSIVLVQVLVLASQPQRHRGYMDLKVLF